MELFLKKVGEKYGMIKKVLKALADLWNLYCGIIISSIIAWLSNFSKNSMESVTSYLLLTIAICSFLTIIKRNFENRKEIKKKDTNLLEKAILSQQTIKVIDNALNHEIVMEELDNTICKTTTILERFGNYMKEKLKNFFKRVWGNKFTITNIVLNLVAVGIADYMLFSDYLLRFELIANNELAFKIIVPILSIIYLSIDIYTTITKYGWESIEDLKAKSAQKALEKASRLSKEQKQVIKEQIAPIKEQLSTLKVKAEKYSSIVKNYQILLSLQDKIEISQEVTSSYNSASKELPDILSAITTLEEKLTTYEDMLK